MNISANGRGRQRPSLVSVIIGVRNGSPLLREQLASIADQVVNVPVEVIVADNGSTDRTRSDALDFASRFPSFKVVEATAHRGQQYARDVGVMSSSGELLVFVDHDDVCLPGWLQGLVNASSNFDAVGGRLDLTSLNDRASIRARPYVDSAINCLPVAFGIARYAIGCNMAMWRYVYDMIRPNELLPWYAFSEDRDTGFRMLRAGLTVGFAHDAVVAYRLRPPGKSLRRQLVGYGCSDAILVKRYRDLGVSGDSIGVAVRKYATLAPRAFKAILEHDEEHWARNELAVALGRLKGSVRFRVLCL